MRESEAGVEWEGVKGAGGERGMGNKREKEGS